ncbi:MAG TPA: efflux RND transporter permease subunit [Vicinamibacteria bacterium]|nr:efflux RND transporter permease subunit [Vicinamibacteria bacterium]
MKITQTAVRRPIATTMFFLIVIVLGVMSFRFLPVDLLPPIEYPRLTIATDYPNVGPEEIEKIITQPIENAISGVPGVERVRSNSEEGESRVTLEFGQGTDLDAAANDLRAALDDIRDQLPPEAETPRIRKFDPNDFPVVIVGANSERNLVELTRILEREVTRRFEQIPGVGSIEVWGGVRREIHVDLKNDRLIATGLSSAQVQQALTSENVTLPGGNVNFGTQRLYVRTLGEYRSLDEIAETVVTIAGGKPVRVKDVAEVRWGYQDLDRLVRIDGKPMVRFGIRKQTGANTVSVAAGIRQVIDRINAERDDLTLFVTSDQSEFIQSSIDNVRQSATWGALLAIFVLYVFLRNGSSTFIIALSIPISIIATFSLLYFNGLTLNQMSFGGLALGVGLIVDNAIVVLENIVRLREEKGKDLETSALVGTREVTGAIMASTITTSVIFLPVVFMQTISGLIFRELALVVVFALVCSLFVALTLVPMLASRFLTVRPDGSEGESKKSWFQRVFARTEAAYGDVIERALHHKVVVFAVTAFIVVFCSVFIAWIPVELAPQTDANQIDIDFMMAEGTNIAVQDRYLRQLEQVVRAQLPMEDVNHLTTDVRDGRAEVEVTMVEASKRSVSTSELADRIRGNLAGRLPGGDIRVGAQSGLRVLRRIFGRAENTEVDVQLRGHNLERARQLAQRIKRQMEGIPGVSGVRIDRTEGRPEQNLIFDRQKIADLGLTVNDVARVIQTNVGGSRAGVYRVEGDEFPIMVRLREGDRLSPLDLQNISVRTPAGEVLPVSSIISQRKGRGPTGISRVNAQRVTYISANLESGVPLGDAVERIQAELADFPLPEGFSIVYGGEYEEQQRAAADFRVSVIMALVLIYMVMAAQFERFFDPLVVMCSVPLAVIGVVPALLLTGTTINIQSLMGVIMLIGIVVNNAIVLVDYINLMRREYGMDVREAVIASGRLRLRPILMTTLTTVLGLLPLSFGIGAGGEIQASLARVVIGGLTASTLVTLVFIPVVYVAKEQLLSTLGSRFRLPFRSVETG